MTAAPVRCSGWFRPQGQTVEPAFKLTASVMFVPTVVVSKPLVGIQPLLQQLLAIAALHRLEVLPHGSLRRRPAAELLLQVACHRPQLLQGQLVQFLLPGNRRHQAVPEGFGPS